MARTLLTCIIAPGVTEPVQKQLWRYLVENTGKENLDTILTEWEKLSYTVRGGDIMTMAEELIRRGKVEGKAEGLKQGRTDAFLTVVRRMLESGYEINEIQTATGFPEERITELKHGIDIDTDSTGDNGR